MLSATRWHRGRDVPVGAEREDEESEGEWVTDNQTTWTRPPSASTDPPCAHRLAAPRPDIRPLWYACFGTSRTPYRLEGPDYVLTHDAHTNTIIAIGTPEFHTQMAAMIEELDQRRPQVLIEMTLVAVTSPCSAASCEHALSIHQSYVHTS